MFPHVGQSVVKRREYANEFYKQIISDEDAKMVRKV